MDLYHKVKVIGQTFYFLVNTSPIMLQIQTLEVHRSQGVKGIGQHCGELSSR